MAIKLRLEHANGEQFKLNQWLRTVLIHQDIPAWKSESGDNFKRNLAAWVKGQLIVAIENLDVSIEE